jgi:hypothetical protein
MLSVGLFSPSTGDVIIAGDEIPSLLFAMLSSSTTTTINKQFSKEKKRTNKKKREKREMRT